MSDRPDFQPLIHITDIDPYFEYDEKTKALRFIGESLEVRTLLRFEVHGLLDVTETIRMVGIADLIIDEKYQSGLDMDVFFQTAPSEVSRMEFLGVEYLVLRYKYGDAFMVHTQVLKSQRIVYAKYTEFIQNGNSPYWMDYTQFALLFDRAPDLCDSDFGIDRSVFEMIFAHLARNPDNMFQQFRHTDMKGKITMIASRSVAYAPTSTTARLGGSYFPEGVNSAALVENTETQEFENLLRGLPIELQQLRNQGAADS